jgi:sarcosine oxidase
VQHVDVVVVGAGAHGSATAWHLARRGRSVVLLERFEQGHVRGSSHGGSRIFRLAYPQADYARMAVAARDGWRELEDDCGEVLLEITGGVDHGDVDDVVDATTAAGIPFELLAPEAAAERWPAMRFDERVVFQPDAGRCLADRAVAALQRRAADHGADVRFGCEVESIIGGEVHTADDSWRAHAVVVAAGAWGPQLLGDVLPPTRVTEERVFHFSGPDDLPSFIHWGEVSHYGLVTPGEGVKVGEHHTGPVVDPDERDFEVRAEVLRRMSSYVDRWLPGLDPMPMSATTCLYTTTPDEGFVLERRGPTVAVSCCSGHGFKFTPEIGRRAADLATE